MSIRQMSIIICPGIHEPELTSRFVFGLRSRSVQLGHSLFSDSLPSVNSGNLLIFPTDKYLAVSGIDIVKFMRDRLKDRLKTPVVFISFSAGVVGAITAAWGWQMLGGKVKALIAIDGWGVPLFGNFPIHRISHDYFTHWSSSYLGKGQDSFYADPPVDHLKIWHSPQITQGWCVRANGGESAPSELMTAAQFLLMLLKRYGISN